MVRSTRSASSVREMRKRLSSDANTAVLSYTRIRRASRSYTARATTFARARRSAAIASPNLITTRERWLRMRRVIGTRMNA